MGILRNIRNRLIGENWGPASVRIPAKWRRAGGEGVRVLVIDSGVPDHGAVVGAIDVKGCRNFVWNEGKEDLGGHATSVCGVLLAWAPKAEITCYKAMDRDGHSDGCMAVLAALRAAVDFGGFDIVSISIAAYRGASKLHEPIQELAAAGTLVIAGAGNDPAKGLAYPAKWDEVVAVGASNRKGGVAEFSAPGADIVMPGVDIRVPWKDGGWRVASGTSLAAPAAAGLAALAISAWRAAGAEPTAEAVRDRIAAIGRREAANA